MDTTSSNNQHTPNATVYGSLIITAGLCTMIFALGEKARTACIIGGVITLAGLILVIIGNRQKSQRAQENKSGNPNG